MNRRTAARLRFRTTRALLVVATVAATTASLAGRGDTWPPPLARGGVSAGLGARFDGLLDVQVDADACVTGPEQCAGLPSELAAPTNVNPVRLVIQVATVKPADDLTLGSFEITTQFKPDAAADLVPSTCANCFEHRLGGTYAIWMAPESGSWRSGSYYVLVRLRGPAAVLPALARVEIPVDDVTHGEPPHAAIMVSPPEMQQAGLPVIFNGANSSDPDSPITCYQWSISSSLSSSTVEVYQGPTLDTLTLTFSVEQFLEVELRVSDDPHIDCTEGGATDASEFSPFTATTSYEIVCDVTPPVVQAGQDAQVPLEGGVAAVDLSGQAVDPESGIHSYGWDCGNGTGATGLNVTCTYTQAGTYVAWLIVTNNCGMVAADQLSVTVVEP